MRIVFDDTGLYGSISCSWTEVRYYRLRLYGGRAEKDKGHGLVMLKLYRDKQQQLVSIDSRLMPLRLLLSHLHNLEIKGHLRAVDELSAEYLQAFAKEGWGVFT